MYSLNKNLSEIIPIHDLRFRLQCPKPRLVRALRAETDLRSQWQDGRLQFELPRLGSYELIVVE